MLADSILETQDDRGKRDAYGNSVLPNCPVFSFTRTQFPFEGSSGTGFHTKKSHVQAVLRLGRGMVGTVPMNVSHSFV